MVVIHDIKNSYFQPNNENSLIAFELHFCRSVYPKLKSIANNVLHQYISIYSVTQDRQSGWSAWPDQLQ